MIPVPALTNEAANLEGEALEHDNTIPFFTSEIATTIDPTFEQSEEWRRELIIPDGATEEVRNSILDQRAVLEYIIGHLTTEHTKGMALRLLFCGSPGVGKSHLLNSVALLLLSKGNRRN